jgi:hypothetical protein
VDGSNATDRHEEVAGPAVDSPRLTIVIPTLNRASLVTRAVESALCQTHPSVEVIVSNNGSTDDTRSVLDKFAGRPRLRIIHRDHTIPAPQHGGFLLTLARGQYFLGLSDDDWLEPDFAEKVIACFDRHPNAAFVWTGCVIHRGDAATPVATGPEIESGIEFMRKFLERERTPCWCAMVTPTASLRRVGPTPPDIVCGDLFYWTKIAPQGDVACVPEALSHYLDYRPGHDSETRRTPVIIWSKDLQRWLRDIVTAVSSQSSADETARMAALADLYLAHATASQFMWRRLRGESLWSLARILPSARQYLRSNSIRPWLRVAIAVLMPRMVLRRIMEFEIKRESRKTASRVRAAQ